ncbi:MAG: hypothetical protein HOI53_02045, partial [Francisellaceae bacterium]|nr:hypothetical protein [Francisellaceae bacterium]
MVKKTREGFTLKRIKYLLLMTCYGWSLTAYAVTTNITTAITAQQDINSGDVLNISDGAGSLQVGTDVPSVLLEGGGAVNIDVGAGRNLLNTSSGSAAAIQVNAIGGGTAVVVVNGTLGGGVGSGTQAVQGLAGASLDLRIGEFGTVVGNIEIGSGTTSNYLELRNSFTGDLVLLGSSTINFGSYTTPLITGNVDAGGGAYTLTLGSNFNTGSTTGFANFGSATLAVGANTFTLDEALTISNVTLATGGSLAVTGAGSLAGALTVNGTNTLNLSVANSVTGNVTLGSNSTLTFTGTSPTIGGNFAGGANDLTLGSNLDLASISGTVAGFGTMDVNSRTFTVSKDASATTVAVSTGTLDLTAGDITGNVT